MILTRPAPDQSWRNELSAMCQRIASMRMITNDCLS